MENNKKLYSLLMQYNAQFYPFNPAQMGWEVSNSSIAGKGIIATKRYDAGDVIFIDYPLVVGPRSSILNHQPFCVGCYTSENLRACSRGCRLPICSPACEDDVAHNFECVYLRNSNENNETSNDTTYSMELLKSLTLIRSLKFDKLMKEIVSHLHKISTGPQQFLEVRLFKKHVTKKLSTREEKFMKTCCQILDANAYEIQFPRLEDERRVSLRGLYPMASIMNHCCCPNTTHVFGQQHQMIIKASTVILPGSEMTSTYSPLLLGTPARRHFLSKSKQFSCTCSRCRDPTEFGTFLSALRCRNKTCDSMLLPTDPLIFHSSWKCTQCDSTLSSEKIAIVQKIIAQQLSRLNLNLPAEIIKYIENDKIVAATNHTIIQFKYILLKLLGYADGYKFTELTESLLNFKRDICNELLNVVNKLSLGECDIKAACLFELSMTNKEIKRRQDGN